MMDGQPGESDNVRWVCGHQYLLRGGDLGECEAVASGDLAHAVVSPCVGDELGQPWSVPCRLHHSEVASQKVLRRTRRPASRTVAVRPTTQPFLVTPSFLDP